MIEFKWCMVESVSPLRVQLDGATTALALDPKLLVDSSALAVGDMVRCEFSTSGQVIIHGRSSGVRPMRKSFPTLAALNAFTGWPGLVGFVEADNSEYVWLSGAWKPWSTPLTTFIPAWVNLTVGNGTTVASWSRSAGLVTVSVRLVFGSTTAISGVVAPILPFPTPRGNEVGVAWAFDSSAAAFLPGALHNGSYFIIGTARVTAALPFTWAAGDWLSFTISYYA